MKNVFLYLLLIFFFIIFPPNVYGFGQEDGFGDNGFGEEGFEAVNQVDYFIHDTPVKAAVLFLFLFLSFFLHQYRRRWRVYSLILSFFILGFYLGGFLCPLVVVQNALDRYNTFFLILFFLPFILAFFRGRLYCGYVCPFGAIQEFFHRKRFRLQIPLPIHGRLHLLKYFLLLFLLIRFLSTREIIFIGLTPFKSLFLFGGTELSIILAIVTALLSVFLYRPFCQYLCPYGAFLGWAASKSSYSITPADCNHCSRCTKVCPLAIIEGGSIDKKECLLCGACVEKCLVHKRSG